MVLTQIDADEGLQRLLERARAYLSDDRIDVIQEAYQFAADSHSGQLRKSGDPSIVHPLDAAVTVADLQLDTDSIVAALLHDVQEDCDVPNDELKRRFGDDVAKLVDGATKLEHITKHSSDPPAIDSELQAENVRKMFLAMAEDVRFGIVKLADRLHNMRTLEYVELSHQHRQAQEAMDSAPGTTG